jgi:hypothetical protein
VRTGVDEREQCEVHAMKPIKPSAGRSAPPARLPTVKFHAVEIQVSAKACAAAQALGGRRFLSRETPPLLPLAQCDRAGECQCRYRHYDDRRADQRRETWGGGSAPPGRAPGPVRTSRGRRNSD